MGISEKHGEVRATMKESEQARGVCGDVCVGGGMGWGSVTKLSYFTLLLPHASHYSAASALSSSFFSPSTASLAAASSLFSPFDAQYESMSSSIFAPAILGSLLLLQ